MLEPGEESRCLSSAMLPTKPPVLKRCDRLYHHLGQWHRWAERSEGHDRVPLIVIWDDHKCTKIIQGEP